MSSTHIVDKVSLFPGGSVGRKLPRSYRKLFLVIYENLEKSCPRFHSYPGFS